MLAVTIWPFARVACPPNAQADGHLRERKGVRDHVAARAQVLEVRDT